MRRLWRRFEGLTLAVAATIYAGWIALALWYRLLPLAVVLPLAVYLTAWHSSLQHETIHALRRLPRTVRTLLALPPLGFWFPYTWYRSEHLRHHGTRDLASPQDPESFYHESQAWLRMNAPLRAAYELNQTFAGRIVIGPALQIARVYTSEARRLLRGDTTYAAAWAAHVGLAGGLLWFLVHCGINPIVYIAFVAYPAASLGLVRSFAEHRYTQNRQERTTIVESRSALSLLFLNNNLHAVHHRSPATPWFELPVKYRADRECNRFDAETPTMKGYRSVARSWFLRPIDSPIGNESP